MSKQKEPPKSTDFLIFDEVIFTHKGIFTVVDKFYGKIQKDEVLSVPFSSVEDWPYHIRRLTNFWWIKFGGQPYMFSHYSPIPKHFYSGFNQNLLNRWLSLFAETLTENLSEKQLKVWSSMTQKIGKHLLKMNDLYGKRAAVKVDTVDDSN